MTEIVKSDEQLALKLLMEEDEVQGDPIAAQRMAEEVIKEEVKKKKEEEERLEEKRKKLSIEFRRDMIDELVEVGVDRAFLTGKDLQTLHNVYNNHVFHTENLKKKKIEKEKEALNRLKRKVERMEKRGDRLKSPGQISETSIEFKKMAKLSERLKSSPEVINKALKGTQSQHLTVVSRGRGKGRDRGRDHEKNARGVSSPSYDATTRFGKKDYKLVVQ